MTDKTTLTEPLPPETAAPTRTTGQKLLALTIILAVLAGGWFFSRNLLTTKPEARRKKPPQIKTVVQLQILQAASHTSDFQAMGTVIAARQLSIKARVSGRVIEVNPNLTPGSFLQADEFMIKIDDEEYQLALERSRNNLQKAVMDLRLEQGNQAVAKREFELIRQYSATPLKDVPMDLALRKPQLAKARAVEAAARIDVRQAELNLKHTVLKAPFNVVVLEKEVTIGSQLSSQSTVAELAGTDEFWIRLTRCRSLSARSRNRNRMNGREPLSACCPM
jgi:multidrug resistance efflux pump